MSTNHLLIEKITRERIYDSVFWKQHVHRLTLTQLLFKAAVSPISIKYIPSNAPLLKPTPFHAYLLRLLHLSNIHGYIDEEIVDLFLNCEYKYIRALGVMFLRLTGDAKDVYTKLEKLYADRSKLRIKSDGWSIGWMDDFVDQLLREDRVCGLILPRLTQRSVLVEMDELEEREYLVDYESESEESEEEESRNKLRFKAKPALQETMHKESSLSVNETNKLRADLGLPPLK